MWLLDTLAIHFCHIVVGWCSDQLDSEAIVEFVRALCAVAQEELDPAHAPRVYGLTKIVEISHFNMSRIRQAYTLSLTASKNTGYIVRSLCTQKQPSSAVLKEGSVSSNSIGGSALSS